MPLIPFVFHPSLRTVCNVTLSCNALMRKILYRFILALYPIRATFRGFINSRRKVSVYLYVADETLFADL